MPIPKPSTPLPSDRPGDGARDTPARSSVPNLQRGLPPGPRLPIVAQTLLWWFRPAWFLERCQRRYGPTFTLRLPSSAATIVTGDPSAVRDIASLTHSDFRVADGTAMVLEPYLGKRSLLLLDGDDHLRERRLLLHAFHGEGIQQYRRIMAEATIRDMATWPLGQPFPLRPRMQAITFEVILRAVFGIDEFDEVAALRTTLERFVAFSGASILLPAFRRDLGALSPWGRFVRLRAAVDAALLDLIRRRRDDPKLGHRTDILSLLLQTRDEDGRQLDDGELRDELLTMLLAGHETTATSLAWTLDLLLHHTTELDRLIRELRGGENTYLDAVIKESLRLRPVISEVGRTLTRPMTIGRWNIPAGATVAPNIFLLHRRSDLHEYPLLFRPQRYLEETPDVSTWMPFGAGLRRCLGAAFAMEEMRVVIRMILTRTQLRAASSSQERLRRRAVTLVPRAGTRVVVDACTGP